METKIYETPQIDIVEVDAEGVFCSSPVPGSIERPGYSKYPW